MPFLLCILLFFAPFDDPRTADPTPEEESAARLAKVRRIYVDILTGGDEALKIRDLLMTSLQSSKQFIITEDEDKADATLRGSGREEVFVDSFQSSRSKCLDTTCRQAGRWDGINAHTQIGEGSSAG